MKRLFKSPSSLVSAEEANQILAPYLRILSASANAGWEAWTSLPAAMRARSLPRTRANIIFDGFVESATVKLEGRKGVQLVRARGLFQIALADGSGGYVLVRFKKLDHDLRTRNVLTRQQQLIAIQADLPGLPPATKIVLGYTLDALQTDIESFWLTCPFGGDNLWEMPVDRTRGNVVPYAPPAQQPRAPRIRSTRKKQSSGSLPEGS